MRYTITTREGVKIEKIAFTDAEKQHVKENVSLISLAASLGYTPVRVGSHYSLKEMDSLIIYNDRTWNRFSGKGSITGGTQIEFMLAFGDAKSVPEAVQLLLEFNGDPITVTEVRPAYYNSERNTGEMELPRKNENYKRLFAYLIKTRGISQKTVSDFVHDKLIYEEADHHNIVFCGRDPKGEVKYAGMRGTYDAPGREPFKCDVPGNDKNYGVNIVNRQNDELKVFEGVIDLMSYIDLTGDRESNKLVLGMVADNPLSQFLKDYNHIHKITFCLDNDEAGLKAMLGDRDHDGMVGLYRMRAYETDYEIPKYGKDWNEDLLYKKNHGIKSGYESEFEFALPVSRSR